MGEQIDVIEAEEFKTPEVKTGLQAFSLIVTGFSFFFTNYKKTTIFLLVALFAVALILYNNINVVKEIYGIIPSGQ
jgi:hypothetical protein